MLDIGWWLIEFTLFIVIFTLGGRTVAQDEHYWRIWTVSVTLVITGFCREVVIFYDEEIIFIQMLNFIRCRSSSVWAPYTLASRTAVFGSLHTPAASCGTTRSTPASIQNVLKCVFHLLHVFGCVPHHRQLLFIITLPSVISKSYISKCHLIIKSLCTSYRSFTYVACWYLGWMSAIVPKPTEFCASEASMLQLMVDFGFLSLL